MHWALRHYARYPDALAKRPIQPVKQGTTTRENYATFRLCVGVLGRRFSKRPWHERGYLANRATQRIRHVGRPEHHSLQPSLLEIAAFDVDLDLPAVRLQQGGARFNLNALGVALPDY